MLNLLGLSQSAADETDFYFYKNAPDVKFEIDSSFDKTEFYDYVHNSENPHENLGNLGLAHHSLLLRDMKSGFQAGFNNFDLYKTDLQDIRYFEINRPFSEIAYSIGSKRENIFRGSHAQNIKNRFQFGFDFARIKSLGIFAHQQTRDANFGLYGIFSSKNNRYHLQADMAYGAIKYEENGGLISDIVDDTTVTPIAPQFYETNITDGELKHRDFQVLFTNSYDFGRSIIDSISDSLAVKRFVPEHRISHGIGTQLYSNAYQDYSPNQDYYDAFAQREDSLIYRLRYHNITNKIEYEYFGLKKGDSLEYKNFRALAGVQHNNIELWQNGYEISSNNLHLYGLISSNNLSQNPLSYAVQLKYYLAGYNQNDVYSKVNVGYDFKKYGNVSASLTFQRQSPDFIENVYRSNFLNWENDFGAQKRIATEIKYQLKKYRLTAHVLFENRKDVVEFGLNSLPVQTSYSYYQIGLSKKMKYKIWNWDNSLFYQDVSDATFVRLPKLIWYSKAYVEGKLFKGNMDAQLGLSVRYNSNFQAPKWNPVIAQFYTQDDRSMTYLPVLDVFINMKVKTLRIFIRTNYLTQGLGARNYYSAYNYPDKGRTFTGGLIWRFYE